MTHPVPVTVVGGYLGAGKTTLINQVLRQADGLRIAVLVNEFGTMPIDADLIVAQEGDVISIAGGCICCAFGDNLVATLVEMLARAPQPEHILIEASGVALPAALASMLSLVAGVQTSGIVVLADAETIEARAQDRYLADTVMRQIESADILVLTKTDLVADSALAQVTAWLKTKSTQAAVVPARQGQCPNEIILGDFAPSADRPPALEHTAQYESFAFRPRRAVDAQSLAERLADARFGLLRAKGFVPAVSGGVAAVQVVGRRATVVPAAADQMLGIVTIGLRAAVAEAALLEMMAVHGLEQEGHP
ncbi:MAG: GTP-binding protein [Pseudomonadota bacterium]